MYECICSSIHIDYIAGADFQVMEAAERAEAAIVKKTFVLGAFNFERIPSNAKLVNKTSPGGISVPTTTPRLCSPSSKEISNPAAGPPKRNETCVSKSKADKWRERCNECGDKRKLFFDSSDG